MKILAAIVLLCCATRAAAADSDTWWRAGGEGAVVIATEVPLKPLLAPGSCRWCEPDDLDDAVARAVVWNNLTLADRLSYATLALDVGLSGWDGRANLAPVAESVALAALTTQAIKFTVGRERPFVHYGLRRLFLHDDDDDVSFCSGHTAIAFAAAVASRSRVGLVLAGVTGYLRMGAGKHYLTDVLAGAVVGVAAGLLVPHLDSDPRGPSIAVMSWTW